MDLPTCPACGQSVLDDDAQDCPFCGAAMDGSSGSKKPVGSKTASPAKAPAKKEPDNADPFAIEQAPVSSKVIPCARKPMKGRMQRVLCPMCETQGFIPKAALGRQVKCANKECLVPVFTASTDDVKKLNPRATSRTREATAVASTETKPTSGGSKKNPMLVYGIVGAIALAATVGLVSYLNSQGVDKLAPIGPLPAQPVVDDEDEVATPTAVVEQEEVPEYRQKALEAVDAMISQARVSGGNRDKAYCRRLTGDSYLRMGMDSEAEAEFAQMDKVSSDAGRSTQYYRISPFVTDYWSKLKAGDAAGATAALNAAKALANTIPTQGDTAWESTIALASALTNAGDLTAATAIIAKQAVDETVESQVDSIRLAAWDASAAVLAESKRKPLSPLVVFSWRRPLETAVSFELAVRGQWNAANQWAESLTGVAAVGESCAVIAAQMADQSKFDSAAALLTVAEKQGPEVLLRTNSALGRKSTTHWEAATAQLAAMPSGKTIQQTGIQSYIDSDTPDIQQSLLKGEAIADYVIAAAQQGNTDAAVSGLNRMYVEVTSAVASTAVLRKASAEVANEEGALRSRIADELRLKDSEVRSRFIQYRRGVDRQLKAAEERHRAVMYMLARVVDGGGVEAVKTVLAATDGLKQEIQLDAMAGLLYSAAAAKDIEFPEAVSGDRQLAVPLFRAEPAPEMAVMASMLSAWQGYLKGDFGKSIALQSSPKLQGLAAATVRYVAGELTEKIESPGQLVESVLGLSNGVWREQCLTMISRKYCRQGQISKAIGAINLHVKSPTQRVTAMYGVVLGALEMEKESTKAAKKK